MRISRKELQRRYGLDLPAGRFKINVVSDTYEVFTVKDDTEGCLLVGQTYAQDFVGNSRAAFNALFAKMQKAESITLTID